MRETNEREYKRKKQKHRNRVNCERRKKGKRHK